jgi:hypothetical protein
MSLSRRLAQKPGTGLLLAAIVGSGISGEKLAGNVAIALLANTAATGAMLVTLISRLGPSPVRTSTQR